MIRASSLENMFPFRNRRSSYPQLFFLLFGIRDISFHSDALRRRLDVKSSHILCSPRIYQNRLWSLDVINHLAKDLLRCTDHATGTTVVENYTKGKNVEEPLEKEKIPIPNLPEKFIWMQVTGGSKMRNLLNYALKAFKDERSIVWSGSGGGMGKAISCAEIVKRRNKDLHQITKICYRKVEEYWEPQMENLDTLVVIREIPTIHILLSKDPLDKNEPGYQAPGSFDTFWRSTEGSSEHVRKQNQPKRNRGPRVSNEEFAAMGLRSDQRKPKHAGSGRIPPKSGGDRQRRIGTSGGGSESSQQM